MKRNGRAKNGVEAKRRRARIARRLSSDRLLDMAWARDVLRANGSALKVIGYDRATRMVTCEQTVTLKPHLDNIELTIGFEPPAPFSSRRPEFHTTGTLEPGGWEKMEAYLRAAGIPHSEDGDDE